jgi:type IV secretory pathway VirB9-like protein
MPSKGTVHPGDRSLHMTMAARSTSNSLKVSSKVRCPRFSSSALTARPNVNYRAYGNVLIVDRLFAAAELRLGGEHQQKVRIVRTDGRPSS